MKNFRMLLMAFAAILCFASCDDTESYADQRNKERSAIKSYIAENNIKVISESEFQAQGNTTNVDENEYVLFDSNGVYMQILRNGCGERIKDGETVTMLCRFSEWNLLNDTLQLTNDILSLAAAVDKLTVKNTSGTFTASFIAGESVMHSVYGSTSVPAGWLVPLTYIQVGRQVNEGDELAKVRLIVPHTQGHQYAASDVYPCLYEITYQRGI